VAAQLSVTRALHDPARIAEGTIVPVDEIGYIFFLPAQSGFR
jgi:hypothetical protein